MSLQTCLFIGIGAGSVLPIIFVWALWASDRRRVERHIKFVEDRWALEDNHGE